MIVAPSAAIVVLCAFNRGRLKSLRDTVDAGLSASALPVIGVASLLGLGAVVTLLAVCGAKHRQSDFDIVMVGVESRPAGYRPRMGTPARLAVLTRLPSGAVLHARGPTSGARFTLLFLHGVGGAAWSWAPQAEALSGRFECLVWEGRGHGAAARVNDAGLADYAHDAREALDAAWAVGQTPVLLVAHSMGAMLALALACDRPQRVRGLFLVDPVYADSGSRPAALKPVLAVLCGLVSPLVRSYQRDGWLSRAVSRRIFRRAFLDPRAMERAWALQREVVPLEYPRMLYESIAGVEGFDFRPFADLVTAPTVIVEARQRVGASSRLASVVERFRAREGVRCEHEMLDGGHYLQLDQPAAVTQRLLAFAESLQV